MSTKPAGRLEIPGGGTGGRGPVGHVGPAAGTGNEHPHPRGRGAAGQGSVKSGQCVTHPDPGVQTTPVPPRPDQQPHSAAGCPERRVVGEHTGKEEVIPAALQVHHGRHTADVAAVVSGLPVRVIRTVTDPLLEPRHPPAGQRRVGIGDRAKWPPRGAALWGR